jgi:hypothetical protein
MFCVIEFHFIGCIYEFLIQNLYYCSPKACDGLVMGCDFIMFLIAVLYQTYGSDYLVLSWLSGFICPKSFLNFPQSN